MATTLVKKIFKIGSTGGSVTFPVATGGCTVKKFRYLNGRRIGVWAECDDTAVGTVTKTYVIKTDGQAKGTTYQETVFTPSGKALHIYL
jgi:hypothetical protein